MPDLKPFFSYFGGKWRVARHYPPPEHETIVEPFAGSAGYSVRYPDRKVLLYDLNPVVCGVWDYLIRATPEDILRLPADVRHVDDLKVCQEAKHLIGFWLNKGCHTPRKSPSSWMRGGGTDYWGENIRSRLASQVPRIKHWKIEHKAAFAAPDLRATWFVDPPYEGPGGRCYPTPPVNHNALSYWCRQRRGQVIVCEQDGATWLPFVPFKEVKTTEDGRRGLAKQNEVVWCRNA